MNILAGSEIELEILVATMNRDSLDFLNTMFQNEGIENHHILIINQTSENCLLTSNMPNVRVINAFDKGLSRSRNLALKHAVGNICLIADDDVIFIKGFSDMIVHAFKEHQDCGVLTFKTMTLEGKPYWIYPQKVTNIKPNYRKILSIEIALNRQVIIENNLQFDELFGLGARFEDGENVFFLKSVFSKNIKALFVPEYIVKHKAFSSSDDVTSERHFFARGAMNYKLYGPWAYFLLIKLIFSLLRKRLISFSDVTKKLMIGIKGIQEYKHIKAY